MYIAALIGSISAFVCSFIPLFGIPFTIVFSITSIVFSVLILKREEKKERKDASIISFIISIIAIIICIAINIASINFIVKVFNNYDNISIDYNNYYDTKFKNYLLFDKTDNNIENSKWRMKINSSSFDGDYCYVEIEVESLQDKNNLNIYDFGIYGRNDNDFIYGSSSKINDYFIGDNLDKGDTKKIMFKFNISDLDNDELYFVYVNDENGVKIRI